MLAGLDNRTKSTVTVDFTILKKEKMEKAIHASTIKRASTETQKGTFLDLNSTFPSRAQLPLSLSLS